MCPMAKASMCRSRPARCRCTMCSWSTARDPTRRRTGASASPYATSRRTFASSRCATRPRWCAARILTETSTSSPPRVTTSTRRRWPPVATRSYARPRRSMPAPTEQRSVRRRLLLGALCALPLAAQGQGSTPDAFLHAIYDPYLKEGFKGQPYWQVSRFFVPELARIMEADMRDAKRRGEVPKLDGDPFVDAQEWQVKDLAITVATEGAKAVGKATFDNFGK